jgi:hypothetical protein
LGAVGFLDGVLDGVGDAAEVFDDQLGEEARVAAGAAGGDEELALDAGQPIERRATGIGTEVAGLYILLERGGQRCGLFLVVMQDRVGVGEGFVRSGHVFRVPI